MTVLGAGSSPSPGLQLKIFLERFVEILRRQQKSAMLFADPLILQRMISSRLTQSRKF